MMNEDGFAIEEVNLMCIFDTGSRGVLIADLTAAIPHFEEPELTEIAEGALAKLAAMSDMGFASLEFYPEYEDYEEQEE